MDLETAERISRVVRATYSMRTRPTESTPTSIRTLVVPAVNDGVSFAADLPDTVWRPSEADHYSILRDGDSAAIVSDFLNEGEYACPTSI